jgi:hypothetical protein
MLLSVVDMRQNQTTCATGAPTRRMRNVLMLLRLTRQVL